MSPVKSIYFKCLMVVAMFLPCLSGCYSVYTPTTTAPSGPESYSSMALSPSGDRLVVGSDQGVHVYQMEPFTELWFVPFSSGVGAVAFSPKDDVVGVKLWGSERIPPPESGENIHTVILFDADTGKQIYIWDEIEGFPDSGMMKLSFSPDGANLVSGRNFNRLSIHDVFTGKGKTVDLLPASGTLVEFSVWGVAWLPTGSQIAFDMPCQHDPVVIVDSISGEVINTMYLDSEFSSLTGVNTLVFNSTGSFLAGDLKSAVAVWNSATGERVKNFELADVTARRKPFALTVAFSPDDTWLASGWDNGAIVIWNVETGEMVKTLQESGEAVNTVLFYGNDRIITQSASEIKVWDLATGKGTTYLGGSVPAP